MPGRQRLAADVGRHLPPFLERVEATSDRALRAPQHPQRQIKMMAGSDVGQVMFQVEAGAGAVVLANAAGAAGTLTLRKSMEQDPSCLFCRIGRQKIRYSGVEN